MISERASNWVERGEPAEPKVASTLRHFLGFDVATDRERLLDEARTLVGMVAADASEIQVASYLGYLEEQFGRSRSDARKRRLEAIAIWHIAKGALVRDRALQLLNGTEVDAATEHERLADWLAARIATAREQPDALDAPTSSRSATEMWFRSCDNPHAFERLYDSHEGLDRLRLFEIILRQESHLQLRFALPRFPDHPPERWDDGATEAQVVVNCWSLEEMTLGGWRGESGGMLSIEREDGLLRVSFVSATVRLHAACRGARIDRFEAYGTAAE